MICFSNMANLFELDDGHTPKNFKKNDPYHIFSSICVDYNSATRMCHRKLDFLLFFLKKIATLLYHMPCSSLIECHIKTKRIDRTS